MTDKPDTMAFDTAYKNLNAAQKKAVDAIEGPVMVVAGPGTGKTQILTLRIANILRKTDTNPENILALTFTESGARNLKERLRTFIGSAAYKVNAFTFHGFSELLIKQYPEAYPKIIGSRPARELEKVNIIEDILNNHSFKLLRPLGDPNYYVNSIRSKISELKREYIDPEALVLIIKDQEARLALEPKFHEKGAHKGKVRSDWQKLEKVIAKNQELLQVFRLYEASLRERRLYDFDDMIIETVRALKDNEDMLLDCQETYQYLLADEHQDVNGSQNQILTLLSRYHDQPNIFVVGDEKQSIFRFQGASLENFLYFEKAYPNTKIISLTHNYRSGQPILDLAHSLVAVDEGPLKALRVPLLANSSEALIDLGVFKNQAVEMNFISDQISASLKGGIEAKQVAVILRTNQEVEAYAANLRQKGVPVKASADSDILEHPMTKAVILLLTAVIEPHNEVVLSGILNQPYWNLKAADVFKIHHNRSVTRPLSQILFSPDILSELELEDIVAVEKVSSVIISARDASLSEAPSRVLARLLTDSGLLTFLHKAAIFESLAIVRRLYDEVEAMLVANPQLTLAGVVLGLRSLTQHQLSLTAPYLITSDQAVTVMTAHKAKGLEFMEVYIPSLTDNKWGGLKSRDTFKIPLSKQLSDELMDERDDDRRLLYVALTRAKSSLHLSYSTSLSDGRELLPSRYLEELDQSSVKKIEVDDYEAQFDIAASLNAKEPGVDPLRDLVVKTLTERGFSATSLNNYLQSPWDFIFRNVLRLPEIQPLHLQYGSVLHSVMEKATKQYTATGKLPNASNLNQFLKQGLGQLPISEAEYSQLHEQGLTEITAYLDHQRGSLPASTKEEFKLKVVYQTDVPEMPEIVLTGMLDRLDFDDSNRLIRVVDYKTGKPKTRNEIEGKTKNADGNYKRQLVFYALLLSLYEDERYHTRETLLSFIKPNSQGKIIEEAFTITDVEIDELKQTINSAVKDIVNGGYLNAPCEAGQSEYYELKKRWFG